METYMDSYGKTHTPSADSKRRNRSGVFAIMISQGHILISWPNKRPEVPEIIGGGIEEGETIEQALIREIEEEADVKFERLEPQKTHSQTIKYYADTTDEYWEYEQTYWIINSADSDAHYFEGERKPSDAVKSKWVPLSEVKNLGLHAIHAKVLEELQI